MRVLVTGAAGFIGGNFSNFLSKNDVDFLGIDNFSSYYSTEMKNDHVNSVAGNPKIERVDICDSGAITKIIQEYKPTHVVHLAAQGGVRASKTDPTPYIETNQIGFLNVLITSEDAKVEKFIYASSSSIYGDGLEAPFSELDKPFTPKSLYALSKTANELMAKHLPLKNTKRVGLRFFTVYGPWGRPDMAVFRILASSLLGTEFKYTANDSLMRDFTYVDDVSKVISDLLSWNNLDQSPEIFNVAGGQPYTFAELFSILNDIGVKTKIIKAAQDELDVNMTHASTEKLSSSLISVPNTSLKEGIIKTWEWIQTIDKNKLRNWYEYSS